MTPVRAPSGVALRLIADLVIGKLDVIPLAVVERHRLVKIQQACDAGSVRRSRQGGARDVAARFTLVASSRQPIVAFPFEEQRQALQQAEAHQRHSSRCVLSGAAPNEVRPPPGDVS